MFKHFELICIWQPVASSTEKADFSIVIKNLCQWDEPDHLITSQVKHSYISCIFPYNCIAAELSLQNPVLLPSLAWWIQHARCFAPLCSYSSVCALEISFELWGAVFFSPGCAQAQMKAKVFVVSSTWFERSWSDLYTRADPYIRCANILGHMSKKDVNPFFWAVSFYL